jgi:hypothetical protein
MKAHCNNCRRFGQCVGCKLYIHARLGLSVALTRLVADGGGQQLPRQVQKTGLNEKQESTVDGV